MLVLFNTSTKELRIVVFFFLLAVVYPPHTRTHTQTHILINIVIFIIIDCFSSYLLTTGCQVDRTLMPIEMSSCVVFLTKDVSLCSKDKNIIRTS